MLHDAIRSIFSIQDDFNFASKRIFLNDFIKKTSAQNLSGGEEEL